MQLSKRKQRVVDAIAAQGAGLRQLGEEIYRHPELGFKEHRTARLTAGFLRRLGLEPQEGLALTGVKAVARGGRPGPTVGLVCELDAAICYDHPEADRETGAVHACGHNLQVTAALGALTGLVETGLLGGLAGNVALLAVPAEEAIDLEFRRSLLRDGVLAYLGGKQEFLRLGLFDDVDVALNVHADLAPGGERRVRLVQTSNGFVVKAARFLGQAAHAGAAPWEGVNALNACLMGLMGIHAQRETFRDQDTVRVHPIITAGGAGVNVVPSDVKMETYVRAATVEAMRDANAKVNRALRAGADCVGARLDLSDLPGYLPFRADPGLGRLFAQNASLLLGERACPSSDGGYHMTASSDLGDLSHYRPSVWASIGCIAGGLHSPDYRVVDAELAYVIPAQILALTVLDLLSGDGEGAREIAGRFAPSFARETFGAFWADILGKS